MLLEATVLGTASLVGFGLTWTRLPKGIKQYCIEHPLITDIVATYATYEVLGRGTTALIGCGIVSVVVSLILYYFSFKRKRKLKKSQ